MSNVSRETSAPPQRRMTGAELQAAKAAARERYGLIAELLKLEAGVMRHYEFDKLGGLAWTGQGRILAPEGVTRRQLYVLAHECGHMVLHSGPGQAKPGHVKEHEAEVYAHRAFERYGLEVPEKSARWARAYVAQWVKKDIDAGIPICRMATEFALGLRSATDALPSLEGMPPRDFSKSLERFVAQGTRVAEAQEQQAAPPPQKALSAGQPGPISLEALRPPFTKEEQALMQSLMKAAKRLDGKHVPGVYNVAAITIDNALEAKLQGRSALPTIARGLDHLQDQRIAHRKERRASLRSVFKFGASWGNALIFAGIAAGFFMAGWGVSGIFHYAGGFLAALSLLSLVNTLIEIATR